MKKHTVRLLLKGNKKNAMGLYPIYLRITVNRKTSFISTGYTIAKKFWEERTESVKEGHPMHEEINLDIQNKKKEILQELIHASVKGRPLSAETVKAHKQLNDIYLFAESFKKQTQSSKEASTLTNYDKHLSKLKDFAGDALSFDAIDVDFLYRFEAWLRNGGVKSREGKNPNNYIDAILRTLRTLFNAARKKGVIAHYPFAQYEMPKTTTGNKPYLTLKELYSWHDFAFATEHPTFKQTALYFLFACYTGLRLSDWRNFAEADIKDRNISVQATKNKAWVAVPLHDRLIQTIALMKQVPLTVSEPTINTKLKLVAAHLGIKKALSTHSGRRTFAVTMCLERGISAETTAKLMAITLAVFEKNYSFISKEKVFLETGKAWKDL